MPGAFFLSFISVLFISRRKDNETQKSAAELRWEMLVSESYLPTRPLGSPCNIHSMVAFTTSAKAKVRERECAPSFMLGLGKAFL